MMLKETGTTMLFDDDRNTFYNPVSNTTLDDLDDDYVPWPRNFNKRALTNDEVQLPAKQAVSWLGVRQAVRTPLRIFGGVAGAGAWYRRLEGLLDCTAGVDMACRRCGY